MRTMRRGATISWAVSSFDADVGAEAVDAFPGRDVRGWNTKRCRLELAVGEQVHVAGGEEVGLAFEAHAGSSMRFCHDSRCRSRTLFVVGLLSRSRRQQIGEQ